MYEEEVHQVVDQVCFIERQDLVLDDKVMFREDIEEKDNSIIEQND